MKVTYYDLVRGFEFVAPGAGKVRYRVDKIEKQTAYCTRIRQNGDESTTDLPTDTILSIVNQGGADA